MSIRRQYSLPNCSLIVEGYSNEPETPNNPRPLLSILMNAECRFVGINQPISGGKVFFEHFIKAVSLYTQHCLSGLSYPPEIYGDSPLVSLVPGKTSYLHSLKIKADTETQNNALEVTLTTVQLFDLVEAIDQFFADSRTLPELCLELQPLPRQYRGFDEPPVQKVAPLVLGFTGLALVASGFFLLPNPKVKEPEIAQQSPTPSPTASSSSSPSSSSSSNSSSSLASSESSSSSSGDALSELINNAPQIVDPTELRYIQRYVFKNVNDAWQDRGDNNHKVSFRVAVGKDGSILSYEPINGTTNSDAEKTPLPQLKFDDIQGTPESIAEFRVTFNQKVLQVSPWYGYQGKPTLGERISDPEKIAQLLKQLQTTLLDKKSSSVRFSRDLRYRVAVTEEGAIADFEADNRSASDYLDQTPLPQLAKPEVAGIVAGKNLVPQVPLAQFKVIFRSNGAVEVSPWDQ